METLIEEHQKEYGTAPDVVASAPSRIHLIGEHTWFFKDKTLSMAVNLPVYVGISRREDSNVHFYFIQNGEKKKTSLASLKVKKEDRWANAIKAVIYGFASGGFECQGMNITISSEVLPSAGIGITTAIKVASAWAIKELFHFRCPESQLLHVLDRANHGFLGIETIKADNFTAIYAKEHSLMLTDYADGSHTTVPFKFKDRTVIITDARVPRISTWNEESLQQPENVLLLGELKERRTNVYGGWHYTDVSTDISEVLSVVNEDVRRHLLCIMNEHKYVLEAESALQKADFSGFARAVNRSHENMRDLYDLSSPETDWLLKRVQSLDHKPEDLRAPVNCGRITGKGIGRSIYTILRSEEVDLYKAKLVEYERIFGFTPEMRIVKPAKGVRLLQVPH